MHPIPQQNLDACFEAWTWIGCMIRPSLTYAMSDTLVQRPKNGYISVSAQWLVSKNCYFFVIFQKQTFPYFHIEKMTKTVFEFMNRPFYYKKKSSNAFLFPIVQYVFPDFSHFLKIHFQKQVIL
jgi:hypothetical protein